MKRWNDLAMRNWTFDGKLELRPRRFIRFSSKPKDENVLVNCCRSQLNVGHLRRICSLSSMAKPCSFFRIECRVTGRLCATRRKIQENGIAALPTGLGLNPIHP